MKNAMMIGLGFFVCFFILLTAVHADSGAHETQAKQEKGNHGKSVEKGTLYQVKASAVRLRTAPDRNATTLTNLNNGERATVFQKSHGWGQTYDHGKEAWVALYLLNKKGESKDHMASKVDKEVGMQQTKEDTKKERSDQKTKQKDDKKEKSSTNAKNNKENQDTQTKHSGKKKLSGYHFVIDPGHGGKDSGAIGSKIKEKTLTLSTAKKVRHQLRDEGATVTLTRTDDTFIPLGKRAQISNATDTDAFISLHYNASLDQSTHGIYTFYNDGNKNKNLANTIQRSLNHHVNISGGGVKQADYKVLRDNKRLAVLTELGFISNPEEQRLVQTDKYQRKAAKGIVVGLEGYFKSQ